MADTFGELAKDVQRFQRSLEDKHQDKTESALDDVRKTLQVALKMNNSVARRWLINDINRGKNPRSTTFVNERVHLPEWAKYLEHGTGIYSDEGYKAPSVPPYRPIEIWAKHKATVDESDAYAIAQKIAAVGNKPHPFIDPVWRGPLGRQHIINENKDAQREALRRHFG